MRRLAEVRLAGLEVVVRSDRDVDFLLGVAVEIADEERLRAVGLKNQPSNDGVTLAPNCLGGTLGNFRLRRHDESPQREGRGKLKARSLGSSSELFALPVYCRWLLSLVVAFLRCARTSWYSASLK
jgi:hypothetical protein